MKRILNLVMVLCDYLIIELRAIGVGCVFSQAIWRSQNNSVILRNQLRNLIHIYKWISLNVRVKWQSAVG